MASRLPRGAIRREMLSGLGDVEAAQPGDERQAHASDQREGVLRRRGHPDRRMWLLIRPRHHDHVVEREVFSGMREAILRPGLENDVERFLEAIAALAVGNAVPGIGAGKAAAPDPEIEATQAELVHRCGLFRGTDRVTQRKDADAGADPHALGATRDGSGQHERHGSDRRDARASGIGRSSGSGEVSLGQPDAVEPGFLRDLGDRERFGERFFLRPSLAIVAFHHQADVHVRLPPKAYPRLDARDLTLAGSRCAGSLADGRSRPDDHAVGARARGSHHRMSGR